MSLNVCVGGGSGACVCARLLSRSLHSSKLSEIERKINKLACLAAKKSFWLEFFSPYLLDFFFLSCVLGGSHEN